MRLSLTASSTKIKKMERFVKIKAWYNRAFNSYTRTKITYQTPGQIIGKPPKVTKNQLLFFASRSAIKFLLALQGSKKLSPSCRSKIPLDKSVNLCDFSSVH